MVNQRSPNMVSSPLGSLYGAAITYDVLMAGDLDAQGAGYWKHQVRNTLLILAS